jgi:hypothetical protein
MMVLVNKNFKGFYECARGIRKKYDIMKRD